MTAYYNEIDPFAAEWLRNLIAAGHIAPGDVDDRSIADVQPDDLVGYTQCHFFAGIGGWSYALRLAGWPDDRPVWTGSCPCQPFSVAGQGRGYDDERHLAPAFLGLITDGRPPVVFGEQVASKAGREWLADLRDQAEDLGYAVGAADICAASVGAPHIRQRLFFGLADADRYGQHWGWDSGSTRWVEPADSSISGGLAHSDCARRGQAGRHAACYSQEDSERTGDRSGNASSNDEPGRVANSDGRANTAHGIWRDPDWLFCRDGKWRPVEPGTCPLAHGVPGRVGLLRGYGNAIVPQGAEEFIAAFDGARREATP